MASVPGRYAPAVRAEGEVGRGRLLNRVENGCAPVRTHRVGRVADVGWIERVGARALGPRAVTASKRLTPPLGPPSLVEHFAFDFRQWDGPRLPWAEDFGKGRGQVYSLDGTEPERSCNEVEVAKRLRAFRDHACWFSEYQPGRVPGIWRPWVSSLGEAAPPWLRSLNAFIREHLAAPRGGMPDVVAWNDAHPLTSAIFVECKGPKEAFKEAQEDWIWAARRADVGLHQLAVSVRPF